MVITAVTVSCPRKPQKVLAGWIIGMVMTRQAVVKAVDHVCQMARPFRVPATVVEMVKTGKMRVWERHHY